MAFHSPGELKEFYRHHGIKPIHADPHTPWPNRADTGAERFKQVVQALLENMQNAIEEDRGTDFTVSQIMHKAATVRNSQVTMSGKQLLNSCVEEHHAM